MGRLTDSGSLRLQMDRTGSKQERLDFCVSIDQHAIGY